MGETQSATFQEQASSPKTWHLAQKHDVLSNVTTATFGQDTDSQQQVLAGATVFSASRRLGFPP